jgi:hypothetical protein
MAFYDRGGRQFATPRMRASARRGVNPAMTKT